MSNFAKQYGNGVLKDSNEHVLLPEQSGGLEAGTFTFTVTSVQQDEIHCGLLREVYDRTWLAEDSSLPQYCTACSVLGEEQSSV